MLREITMDDLLELIAFEKMSTTQSESRPMGNIDEWVERMQAQWQS